MYDQLEALITKNPSFAKKVILISSSYLQTQDPLEQVSPPVQAATDAEHLQTLFATSQYAPVD